MLLAARGIVALRLWDMAVRSEVGFGHGRQGAEAAVGAVFGLVRCNERRWAGQPDVVPVAAAAAGRKRNSGNESFASHHK